MYVHARADAHVDLWGGRDEGQISQWRLTFSVMRADNCGEKAEVPFVKTVFKVATLESKASQVTLCRIYVGRPLLLMLMNTTETSYSAA